LHTHLHLQNANTAQGRRSTERWAARHGCTRSPRGGGVAAMARMGAAGRRPRPPPPAQHTHGTKAGFTAVRDTAQKGTLDIRAGGASRARRGARRRSAQRRGATRGDPPAHLQKRQESPQKRRQLWDITAWGSLDPRLPLHSATRRVAASPMGRRRRARTNRSGSKARTQAVRLRRLAQGKERGDHGAHRGSTVKA
jgi:hypothetical protein